MHNSASGVDRPPARSRDANPGWRATRALVVPGYFARFTKSRKCFACAFSEGMWIYIMCPAS